MQQSPRTHRLCSSISKPLSDNHIITPWQHGCRLYYSCEIQCFFQLMTPVFGDSEPTRRSSISAKHLTVPQCSKSFGIRGNTLAWIYFFLSSIERIVVVNGSQSSWFPVTSGLLRGPLIFLSYFNDIISNIRSEIRLFADICILYRTISNITDCIIAYYTRDIDKLLARATVW